MDPLSKQQKAARALLDKGWPIDYAANTHALADNQRREAILVILDSVAASAYAAGSKEILDEIEARILFHKELATKLIESFDNAVPTGALAACNDILGDLKTLREGISSKEEGV